MMTNQTIGKYKNCDAIAHRIFHRIVANSKQNFLRASRLETLNGRQRMEMISVFRLSLDLTHAVSTLPAGWLWGGKLRTWHVGAIGTTSAMIGIFQFIVKQRLKK